MFGGRLPNWRERLDARCGGRTLRPWRPLRVQATAGSRALGGRRRFSEKVRYGEFLVPAPFSEIFRESICDGGKVGFSDCLGRGRRAQRFSEIFRDMRNSKKTKFRVSPVWDFDPSSQVIPDCNSQLVQTEPVPSGSTEAEQFVADHKRWFQSATRGLDQRIGHT